jgi:Tannase and feruloyl esterase
MAGRPSLNSLAGSVRTGLSNLAVGQWIPVAFNQIAPKDAEGKPIIAQAITDADRKLIIDSLLKQCDGKDGVADGMISDPLACDFDPAMLTCKEGKTDSCLTPEKVAAIKKAIGGPKTAGGIQVYPGFLYDTGIAASSPIRGILSPGPGIFGAATTAMDVDVEKEALAGAQPLVDSMSVNLTTFSAHEGKLIFYHGDSDPWFSPLDTFDYYKDGCREWRPRRGGEVEPVLLCARNGPLRRWPRAGSIRFIERNRQLGRERQDTHIGDRDRQGFPRSQPPVMPLP